MKKLTVTEPETRRGEEWRWRRRVGVVSCEDRDADNKGDLSDQRDSRHNATTEAPRARICPTVVERPPTHINRALRTELDLWVIQWHRLLRARPADDPRLRHAP